MSPTALIAIVDAALMSPCHTYIHAYARPLRSSPLYHLHYTFLYNSRDFRQVRSFLLISIDISEELTLSFHLPPEHFSHTSFRCSPADIIDILHLLSVSHCLPLPMPRAFVTLP